MKKIKSIFTKIRNHIFYIPQRNFGVILLAILLSILGILYFSKADGAAANWYDSSFQYRQRIPISNSGSALTNYQVGITVNTSALISASKMQSDCDDIRFTAENGEDLPFWIEENNPGCNQTTTKIWIKVPAIDSGDVNIYLYYGNSSVTAGSDGNQTFLFFDDFNNGVIDTPTWSDIQSTSPSVMQELGSTLQLTAVNNGSGAYLITKNLVSDQTTPIALETKLTVAGTTGTNIRNRIYLSRNNVFTGQTIPAIDFGLFSQASGAQPQVYFGGAFTGTGITTTQNIKIIQKLDGTNFTYTVKDAATGSNIYNSSVGNTSTDYRYVHLGSTRDPSASGTSRQNFDWVIVRKAAATEPTVGTFGTEETTPGPVGYWKLNEGYGTSVQDSSGNTNNGSFNGAPSWQAENQCISGKCLSFDGTDDAVTTVDKNEFSPIVNDITISVWAKVPSESACGGNTCYIMSKGTTGQWEWGLYNNTETGVLFVAWSSVGAALIDVRYSMQMNDNKWHYYAVSVDYQSTVNLYVDGELRDTDSTWAGAMSNGTQALQIGRRGTGQYFRGFIDEPKIFPYAKTAQQIKTDYIKGASGKGSAAVLGISDQSYLSNGLVGYWQMDENTGVATSDASGNNYSSVLGAGNSAPAWGSGKYGSALSFDGANDYSQVVSSSTAGDFTSGQDFTISAWVNKTTIGASGAIAVKKTGTPASGSGYEIYINPTGKVAVYISDGTNGINLFSTSVITAATWSHITVVYKHAESLKAYINGVDAGGPIVEDAGSLQSIGSLTTTNKLTFGTESDRNAFFFDGSLDDIRVYNRAFSPREVSQLSEWAAGPVAYYKMDDGSGSTAVDISGNQNNGTLGSGNSAPIWTNGKFGNALEFDGTNDYVDGSDPSSVVPSGSVTVSTWIKLKSTSGFQSIGGRWGTSTNDHSYKLAIFNGGTAYIDVSGTGSGDNYRQTNTVLTPGVWYFLTGVYIAGSSPSLDVYINGVLDNGTLTGTIPSSLYTGSSRVRVGVDTVNFFGGLIDDFKIYNYARTQKQIIQDMNAGHPSVGSPVGSPRAHWKLDEGYGTTINSSGSSTVAGTITGATWINEGKFGKALNFDGAGNRVVFTSAEALNITEGTVSFWINSDQNQANPAYAFAHPQTGDNSRIYFSFAGDNVIVGRLGTAVTIGSYALTNGKWHHVAMTWNGTSAAFYGDGKDLTTTSTFNGLTSLAATSIIGAINTSGSQSFDGKMDEIKIYNYSLTPDEIKVEFNRGKAVVLGSTSTGLGGTAPDNSASREYCVPGDSTSCAPPVGEWNFNENIGSSAMDIGTSGNFGSFGTGNSAPTWTTGIKGSALKFDGTNDYVNTKTGVAIVSGDFTMSGWVYFDVEKNYSGVFGKFNDCAGSPVTAYDFCIGAGAGGVMWAQVTNATGSINTQAVITESYAGQWMHLTMVWDGVSKLDFYKNGVLRSTITQATTLSTTKFPVRFGGGAGRHMPGKIDEVRLYDYARTPAQVAWEYNKGGPIAWYKMDECQGTTAYNSVRTFNDAPAGNNGTITIGVTGSQTTAGTCTSGNSAHAWNNGATGKYGASLNFDGTSDYVTTVSATTYGIESTTAPFSINVWAKTTGTGEYYLFDNYDGSPTSDISVRFDTGRIEIVLANGTTTDTAQYGSGYNDGNWHNIILTWDGASTEKVYVDGKQIGTKSISFSGGTFESGSAFRIAQRPSAVLYFPGQIDDVKVFKYALTPTQVKTEYNGGTVRFR